MRMSLIKHARRAQPSREPTIEAFCNAPSAPVSRFMAVYTEVAFDEAQALIQSMGLGQLTALKACSGGIENTNYFITVLHGGKPHDFVLTLFERLNAEQLPFYLRLVRHLARAGLPVPDPAADLQGSMLQSLKGKPTAVVEMLAGHSELSPMARHCAMLGAVQARMHLAARDFELRQPHLRGLDWWNQTAPQVMPFLDQAQSRLLSSELAYQNHVAQSSVYAALPKGPVHADLFRDNVMFAGSGKDLKLTGVFDFYFAGVDSWLFDLAVALNDWCVDLATGQHDEARASSLLAAYAQERPLIAQERLLFNAMLRAAALRFWISRLWDQHLPRAASLLKAHDPTHFERVLRQRIEHPVRLAEERFASSGGDSSREEREAANMEAMPA